MTFKLTSHYDSKSMHLDWGKQLHKLKQCSNANLEPACSCPIQAECKTREMLANRSIVPSSPSFSHLRRLIQRLHPFPKLSYST